MTLLLSCQSLKKSFGSRKLFQDLSLSIFEGDRTGLIGPNGSGKSTFLKILAGIEKSDDGIVSIRKGVRVGYVPQSCEFPDISPEQVLLEVLANEKDLADYEKELLVDTWLSKLYFHSDMRSAAKLSGGWKKRLSFAKEMILSPDLLLLDEPTNHLDLEGILWLEKFLAKEAPSYLLVSHDRYFLEHVTNKIVEINPSYPKGTFTIEGNYSFFLEKKNEFLEGQIQQEQSLATKVRRETEWLRKSPKARTTKSQARIDDAHEILQEFSAIQGRNSQKKAAIDFTASERETKKLLVAKNLGKKAGDRVLFEHLDFTLSPGTRMGLMGPNGSGKTTLLKLLSQEILPDMGTIKQADALKIVYFDQHRIQLPDNISLREALSPNGDFVMFRGNPIHVNGWCRRFLFSPDILDLPLSKLSGGERARISIAHLMLQPADLLLLDEPTNDLDIPTLETLEQSLIDFPGAVVLITHDRFMLERLCNVFMAFGDPTRNELYADYAQWENSMKKETAPKKAREKKEEAPEPAPKIKLSYQEKKEYDQLESKISRLETELQKQTHLLEQSEAASNPQELAKICQSIEVLQNQIEQLYLRWQELEKKQ